MNTLEINDKKETRFKKVGFPRASRIDHDCMRQLVLMAHNKITKVKEVLDFNSRMTFAWGNSLHSTIQNTELVFKDTTKRGWWRCLACNKIVGFGKKPSPEYKCKFCGARSEALVYHEHYIEVKTPFYMTAHPDLTNEVTPKELLLCEIKSIAKDAFKKLEKPVGEHVLQGTSYLFTIDKNESKLVLPPKYEVNTDEMHILYVTKEALRPDTKAYKIFRVRRNKIYQGVIEEKLYAFKEGYENYPNKLPAVESICMGSKFSGTLSKECVVSHICQKMAFEGY